MFDNDSRQILVEVETDVYVLGVILDALPVMAGIVREDKKLKSLHEKMKARVYELYSDAGSGQDIEKMLVCGFSEVK